MPYPYYSNLPVQPTSQPMYTPQYMNMNMMQQPIPAQPMMAGNQQQMPQQAQMQPAQTEALNNGGFIVVPSEEDVKKYPVAPGNFVTFRIENQPILIEKSMSRSQFASPHYERYKLSKEDASSIGNVEPSSPTSEVDFQSEIDELKKLIKHVSSQLDAVKEDIRKPFKSNNNSNNNNDRKYDKKDNDR